MTARASLFIVGSLLVACSETPNGGGEGPASGGTGALAGNAGNTGPSAGTGGSTSGGSMSGGTSGAGTSSGGNDANGGAGATGGAGTTSGGVGGNAGDAAGGSGGTRPSGATGGASGQPGGGGGAAGGGNGGSGGSASPSLLVFSRTAGFRHDSIPNGIQAIATLASQRGWSQMATENASVFSDTGLAPFNVIVFLITTGDVLDANQQAAFERYIRSGRGFVGVHSATDTEFDWPFYGELIGAYFREHPAVQPATIVVENAMHPSTAGLPMRWTRTDEWYAFRTNPRANVQVLLSLDETSYTPGTSAMSGDHPIAWFHVYEGARCFQTALGHTRESYTEPLFLQHLAGGIEWAAGR